MSNYKFKTTNIRGKQYVEVNERIKFFRQEDEYKNWTISTEFTALDSEMCVCKCIIADVNQRVIATGHAHEERSSSHINKTSYVENCETSAIGRALAMMGIGIDTSIASANEVQDAIAKQDSDSLSSSAPVENIMDKAIAYIKSSTDKKKAFEQIMSKYMKLLEEMEKKKVKIKTTKSEMNKIDKMIQDSGYEIIQK